MDKKRLWSIVKLILKIAISGVSLYLVFRKIDLNELKNAISTANPLYLFFALLAFLISTLITASRLNSFFKGIGLNISNIFNFKIYLLGMFYNLFLPGGIGGDGYKIFYLRKRMEIKAGKLFKAIFFDRLSGFWALGLIISALIIFIPQFGIPNWIPILVVIIASIAYYFFMKRYLIEYSHYFISTHLKAILVQSMQVICVIFLLFALHFDGKISPYLFIFLVSSLVAVIPFTMGGLGAREMVFLYGADVFKINEHIGVTISLLFYCTSALVSLSGMYFVINPKSLEDTGGDQGNLKEVPDLSELNP
ncbi:MAG: flippase-like domain-containing protein [Flavobacterium sp.]|nr:flippase-like domain-containing protein [Pedobacter sp.]